MLAYSFFMLLTRGAQAPNKRVQRTRLRSPLTRQPLGDVWGRTRAPIAPFRTRASAFGVGEGVVMFRPEELGVRQGVGR